MTLSCNQHDSDFKVIYGEDDRLEVSSLPPESREKKWADQVALVISRNDISQVDPDFYKIKTASYAESYEDEDMPICANERFRDQLMAQNGGSGFLINGQRFVTASHVIPNQEICNDSFVVFDYTFKVGESYDLIPAQNVYRCQTVLLSKIEFKPYIDVAVVSLNRPVDRDGLLLASREQNLFSSTMTTIGHPLAMPMKIDLKGLVFSEKLTFFLMAADIYGGNSGSPVISNLSGEVAGVIVNGESDFIFEKNVANPEGCWKTRVCSEGDCRGEYAIKSSVITSLLKFDADLF